MQETHAPTREEARDIAPAESLLPPERGAGARSYPFLLSFVLTVTILSVARDILIPVAVAILLVFILVPIVRRIEHFGASRAAAVIATTILAASFLSILGWLMVGQLAHLASELPAYRTNITTKFETLGGPLRSFAKQSAAILNDFRKTFEPPGARTVVVSGGESPLVIVGGALAPLLWPAWILMLVVVITLFVLFNHEDLRNKIIRLVAHGEMGRTTQAIDDAAHRVSRFLLMQLTVNLTFGVCLAIGLFFIGLPNALLWGLFAAILRFIPYLGAWISAILPITLAIVVSDGWTMPALVLGLYLTLEALSSNLLEPWLFGASTGLTPTAVLIAGFFWAWLWGPVGLLIATPLTVCLVVVGRYVPQLEFLHILLGADPVLTPAHRFYQRVLAGDRDEAADILEEYLREHTLGDLHDEVALPALSLCRSDFARRIIDARARDYVYRCVRELIEEVHDDGVAPESGAVTPLAACVPLVDEADEIAGMMLGRLLREDRIGVAVFSQTLLSSELQEEILRGGYRVVIISALAPFPLSRARYFAKRLRANLGGATLTAGLWNMSLDLAAVRERFKLLGVELVTSDLRSAREAVRGLLQQ